MSHSQFHCTGRVYLDLHGLIFETSICYWQDQPGSPFGAARRLRHPPSGEKGGPDRRARSWGLFTVLEGGEGEARRRGGPPGRRASPRARLQPPRPRGE